MEDNILEFVRILRTLSELEASLINERNGQKPVK